MRGCSNVLDTLYESRSAKAHKLGQRDKIAALALLQSVAKTGPVPDTSETILAAHTVLALPLADPFRHRSRFYYIAAFGAAVSLRFG